MGAAAVPVVGAVIASVVVSKAVSSIGPKLGLSESTSNMLGVAAGMYAGGVVGGGSTAASAEAAGATSTQVGADIPAGYGGPAGTHHPGVGGAPAGTQASGAVTTPVAGPGGAPPPVSISDAVAQGAQAGAGQFQAPTTPPPGIQHPGVEGAGELTAAREGLTAPVTGGRAAGEGGMLAQSQVGEATTPATSTQTGQMATQSRAKDVIRSELTQGRGPTSLVEQEGWGGKWWERLFTPEKTMDLAMAAMQGYNEAAMAKEEREYPQKVRDEIGRTWERGYGGGGMLSMGRNFPSQ